MISWANGTGWRKLGEATSVPSLILVVAAAAEASVVTASYQGPSGMRLKVMWS